MTPDYVRRFLKGNHYDLNGRIWVHPDMGIKSIDDDTIDLNPQLAFDKSFQDINNKHSVLLPATSQPAVTFNPNPQPPLNGQAIGLTAGAQTSLAQIAGITPQWVRDFLSINNWQLNSKMKWLSSNNGAAWMIDDPYIDTNPVDCYKDAYAHMKQGNYFILTPAQPNSSPITLTFSGQGINTGVPVTLSSVNGISLNKVNECREKMVKAFISCECGAAKCKTTHAHWCPMYRRY